MPKTVRMISTDAAPPPVIALAGVRLAYRTAAGGALLALDQVDLVARSGEFVAVVGPVGCGKSTLLKLIAGLLPPSAGTIRIDGEIVRGPTPRVGLAFQNPLLRPERSVLENILLPIEVAGGRKEFYVETARQLMALFGLSAVAGRKASELPDGMQQRVSLCRALIHDPQILLLDEVFQGLDEVTRTRLNADLQRVWLRLGKTVLAITHNIAEAVYLADRVLVMQARDPGASSPRSRSNCRVPRRIELAETAELRRLVGAIRDHLRASGSDP